MTPGTLPVWYDPTFFYQGLQVRFGFGRQIRAIVRNSRILTVQLMKHEGPLFLLIGILCIAAFSGRARIRLPISPLTVWALSALCLYVLVTVTPRYVAPFSVLLMTMIFGACCDSLLTAGLFIRRSANAATVLCLAIWMALFCRFELYEYSPRSLRAQIQYQVVAAGMSGLGIAPGANVAVVGSPFVSWARTARLHIGATIGYRGGGRRSDVDSLWTLSPAEFEALCESLRTAGIRAIVSAENCDNLTRRNWMPITGTRYCVYKM